MLATLDFNLAKDEDGNDIPFKATFVNAINMYVRIVLSDSFSKRFQPPQSIPVSAHPSPACQQTSAWARIR